MEMVATPVVFALLGFLLDRWLGTTPLLTIVLAVFALVGSAVATWYRYDASMKEHEAEFVQRRDGTGATATQRRDGATATQRRDGATATQRRDGTGANGTDNSEARA